MERIIDKIREEFPLPLRVCDPTEREEGWYCVMVAFMYYQKKHNVTIICQGDLKEITKANNEGNFELAWELLANGIEKGVLSTN